MERADFIAEIKTYIRETFRDRELTPAQVEAFAEIASKHPRFYAADINYIFDLATPGVVPAYLRDVADENPRLAIKPPTADELRDIQTAAMVKALGENLPAERRINIHRDTLAMSADERLAAVDPAALVEHRKNAKAKPAATPLPTKPESDWKLMSHDERLRKASLVLSKPDYAVTAGDLQRVGEKMTQPDPNAESEAQYLRHLRSQPVGKLSVTERMTLARADNAGV